MRLETYVERATGRSLIDALKFITPSEKEGGGYTFTRWDLPGIDKPSDADIDKALAAPEPLDALKAAKSAELRVACSAAILGGFPSSALGSAHVYPSSPTDQSNMAASVLDSVVPGLPADWTTPFWCADDKGAWSFAPHSAEQIQKAGRDGKAWVLAAQGKLAGLEAHLAAAKDAAAVEAIAW